MAAFVAGVAIGLIVAALVSGHVDRWLNIQEKKAEKKEIRRCWHIDESKRLRKEHFLMSKYIKKETKGQIIFVVMIILAIAIGLLWNALEERNSVPTWEPEGTYPMANANISWEQTHYAGGWGENNGGT